MLNLATAPPTRATVLVVDREALYRWFVAESLRGCDVDVVPCGSMDEATDVVRRTRPDLTLVDGELLDGRGAETLDAIRVRAGARPCVVLDSGIDVPPSRVGPVTVVEKPVDTAAVIALVTTLLRQSATAA